MILHSVYMKFCPFHGTSFDEKLLIIVTFFGENVFSYYLVRDGYRFCKRENVRKLERFMYLTF